MEKEAPEEIGNRKTEAPKNIRKENNRFVSFLMGKRLPRSPTPMDNAMWLNKMLSHQIQKMGVSRLTRFPPVDLHLANGSVVHLPLCSRPLQRHKNNSFLLHARGLAVASFSRHWVVKVDEFLAAAEEVKKAC
jgi:hypothetical protein